ncbi:DUF6549 family protein [Prevotella melaninogenica]|jgi:hypothetical protein|uniref:DUF6549 family protein n=1 Tax=Prevotella melaninogenica TaxID=28132 RepID=UPI001C5E103D|nr:DUF6549 family protein [Prevotella melaninogenica]MBW4733942.1 hypothetical protein [Prevotella melaninogenica]MBW4736326.1 hypothetical protein [Prevotella melaninogenica]MBW4879011.1 hypothetical protein [Prevotella melaninogenica]
MMSLIIKILHGFGVWFWSKLGSKERHISDLLVPVLLVAIAAESVALYRGYERNRKIENTSKTLANSLSNIGKAPEKAVLSTKKGSIQALVATPSGLTNKNIKDRYSEDIKPIKSIGVNAKDVTGIQKITTDTRDTIYTPMVSNSFGGLEAHYKDNFATINVSIDSTRNSIINYSIRDSLVIINFQKKHSILFGLIKWRESKKVEVHSLNPKTTISGFEVIHKIE